MAPSSWGVASGALVMLAVSLIGCGSEDGGAVSNADLSDGRNTCDIPAPAGASCNPYCPDCGDGEHCGVVGNVLKCTGTGVRIDGDSCTASDQCGQNMGCFGLGSQPAVCHRFCTEDSQCRPGDACTGVVELEGGLRVNLCETEPLPCAPYGDPCPFGQACYLGEAGAFCRPEGALPVGAPCRDVGAGACQAGLQCIVACTPTCRTVDDTGQPGGECASICEQWTTVDTTLEMGICTDGVPLAECQLFGSDCTLGESCYPLPVGWLCVPDGSVSEGGACTRTADCAPDHACTDGRCRSVCLFDSDGSSSCEVRCAEGADSLDPVSWGVGVCKLP